MNVLLDTNMLIYREDHSVINDKVLQLTKILYDSSEYKIVVHPMILEDLNNIKDEEERNIILSKVSVYKKIDKPPKAPQSFHEIVGCSKIPNDGIDNNLLYAVYKNCVSYLITNDNKLRKKAKKINIDNRVLGIDDAINFFAPLEEKKPRTPVFISEEYLYNINLDDTFFDSLKKDYLSFEEWFINKAKKEQKAYVSYLDNNELGSFLMMKIEDENEDYSKFKEPFEKGRRLKISTFKVKSIGNKIGESYIKIIIEEAINKKVDEVYVTVFKKQERLIELFSDYGFKLKTTKMTQKQNFEWEEELVLVKNMNDDTYPNFNWEDKNVFVVPIQQKYHEKLFPESEQLTQISFDDIQGINTYSNSIKKAYICKAQTQQIKSGDILLFYASEIKRSITTIGIVDNVFSNFKSCEELYSLAIKRTVYSFGEIEENYSKNSKLILFKYYKTLSKPIVYEELINNKLLKGAPMSIVKVDNEVARSIIQILI